MLVPSLVMGSFVCCQLQIINVGLVSGIRAMRLTHTGEDGFLLYVPSEVGLAFLYIILHICSVLGTVSCTNRNFNSLMPTVAIWVQR